MGSRRDFLKGSAGIAMLSGCSTLTLTEPADTLIVGERIAALGSPGELEKYRGPNTRVIDAGRRIVIPGLNDAHTHFIRGGLTYTNEAVSYTHLTLPTSDLV